MLGSDPGRSRGIFRKKVSFDNESGFYKGKPSSYIPGWQELSNVKKFFYVIVLFSLLILLWFYLSPGHNDVSSDIVELPLDTLSESDLGDGTNSSELAKSNKNYRKSLQDLKMKLAELEKENLRLKDKLESRELELAAVGTPDDTPADSKPKVQEKKSKKTSVRDNRDRALITDPDYVINPKQQAVIDAFKHAWKGYKTYAWGKDMLLPVSRSHETWFDLGLTLLDALDTMYLMGLQEEFKEARNWVATELNFNKNVDVNLFETTIRVVGGLLTTAHLSQDKMFLDKAVDCADRLLAAFNTNSGVPLSDVNLGQRTAHAPVWAPWSSTAEVSTIQIEFKYISHLTGDMKYANAVIKTMDVLNQKKPADGLVPMYVDPQSGNFQHGRITLGARGDSYYEYLLKQWLQTNKTEDLYKNMYEQAVQSIITKLVGRTRNGLTYIAELENGQQVPKMDHLVCFLAGTLALGAANGLGGGRNGEHMKLAEELAYTCWKTYEEQPTGLAPEISHFSETGIYVKAADTHNLLRPETIESFFIIYRITGDEKYRDWGWKMFESFEKHTKIEGGGYSSLQSVVGGGYRDKMESFFLGETLKYFFLLFDDSKLGLVPLEHYVFNTEAHPLPVIPPLQSK